MGGCNSTGSAETGGSGGSSNYRKEVQDLIVNNKVMVFSKTSCGFCHKLKNLFRAKGLTDLKIVEVDEI